MTMTINRRRALLLGGGFTIVLLLTLMFPGVFPWAASANSLGDLPVACSAHYYALDPGKESTNAFGPPIAARDEATIKSQLYEHRFCGSDQMGDPTLTAAHYAAWSAGGFTAQKVDFSGIDAFSAKLVADHTMWKSVVDEMTALENASTFSLVSVPAGSPSLYMVPDGTGGVTTHQGVTIGNGTAVLFTHDGFEVEFRLECEFQNVRKTFPGVLSVPPGSPELPKLIPTPTPTPTTATCLPGQVENVNGVCVAPKSSNPKDYRQPGDGGKGADVGVGTKPKATVTTPAETTPAAVTTTTQTGGGGTTDSSTATLGSQSGLTAQGAAPAATTSPSPLTNEGGANNGTVSSSGM